MGDFGKREINKVSKEEYEASAVRVEVAFEGDKEAIDARCCLVVALAGDDAQAVIVGGTTVDDLLTLVGCAIKQADFALGKMREAVDEDHE